MGYKTSASRVTRTTVKAEAPLELRLRFAMQPIKPSKPWHGYVQGLQKCNPMNSKMWFKKGLPYRQGSPFETIHEGERVLCLNRDNLARHVHDLSLDRFITEWFCFRQIEKIQNCLKHVLTV